MQSRVVICRNSHGNQDENMCEKSQKPPGHVPCNQHPCPTWHHGNWSECNANCERQRQVKCRTYRGTDCPTREIILDRSRVPINRCRHPGKVLLRAPQTAQRREVPPLTVRPEVLAEGPASQEPEELLPRTSRFYVQVEEGHVGSGE